MLASVLILGAAAVAALVLTLVRSTIDSEVARHDAARSLAWAACVQAVHFAEEATTGFHERLPALLGLSGIPFSLFLLFNVAWLLVWAASVPGLRSGRAGALFAAWFLAIAGVINGIAHPLLAAASGGYFPGLWTSPFIGVASALLWLRLSRATHRDVSR